MNKQRPPEINMTIDGEFVAPPTVSISSRIMIWAVVVAMLAAGLSIAALALWLALIILPVAFGAGVVAWGIFRYRIWRAQRSLSGGREIWRP